MAPCLVTEFIDRVLGSLPRRDQRLWGSRYITALLSVSGRKTMRSLAGERQDAVEQSFQQFISKSPWDWQPVRKALALSLHEAIEPTAWVVETDTIAKAGRHSVGVAEQFVAKAGRVLNCQQAAGLWLASDRISCPVDWALALPAAWTDEPRARARADIPEGVRASSPVQAAIDAVIEAATSWGICPRPVVMEVEEAELQAAVAKLSAHGINFVLKVAGTLAVTPVGPGPDADGSSAIRAAGLIESLAAHRLPAFWTDPAGRGRRVTPVVSTGITLPPGRPVAGAAGVGVGSGPSPAADTGAGREADHGTGGEAGVGGGTGVGGEAGGGTGVAATRPLVLLGAWTTPTNPATSEFWVSNLHSVGPAALFAMAVLARRVHGDFARIAVPLGIRDFEGRSYRGWHHHATMVSVAHAIAATSRASGSVSVSV